MPPAVPHRLIRPRRPSRSERAALRRMARGTGEMSVGPSKRPAGSPVTPASRLALTWGIGGVIAILVESIVRLIPRALEAVRGDLGLVEAIALVAWVAFCVYVEGYRAFQRQFSPRVVARAQRLAAHPRRLHLALAPFFCMGFFHATRRRIITTWLVTIGVVAIVMAVRHLGPPWRGIVDAGVVLALIWGAVALVVYTARAVRGVAIAIDPDLP